MLAGLMRGVDGSGRGSGRRGIGGGVVHHGPIKPGSVLKICPGVATVNLVDLAVLDRILAAEVKERFDHRNINLDVPEFADGKMHESLTSF